MSKCVNCLKEINEKEAFCLTCHEEVLGCAKNQISDLEAKLEESEKQVEFYKEENEILNVALDLACQNLYDINFKLYNTEMDFKEYFKQQALTHQREDKGEQYANKRTNK